MLRRFFASLLRYQALVVAAIVGVLCLSGGQWSLSAQSDDLPKLTSVDTGSPPQRIAVGGGAVWVSNLVEFNPAAPGPGILSRIDPSTKRVVNAIALGKEPAGIALGFGSVWVAHRS
jgi:hypothetical protein